MSEMCYHGKQRKSNSTMVPPHQATAAPAFFFTYAPLRRAGGGPAVKSPSSEEKSPMPARRYEDLRL
jgi:hypothetical protein